MELFVFRFEKLLKYRQYQESLAKDQLQRSYAEYQKIAIVIDQINQQKKQAMDSSRVWIQQNNWNYLWMNDRTNLALKHKLKNYQLLSKQRESVVNEHRQILNEKRKKVHILENLKERHYQYQIKEWQSAEQIESDEITQFKFHRQNGT